MASSLRSNLSFFSSSYTWQTKSNNSNNYVTIRCGPRNNRGPLYKGRILSTEAMQAIQALKRAKGDETKINELISKNLTRLIKNDLIASLNELLRQDQCHLSLKVFTAVRSELWYKPDCSLYADMVSALARNGMAEEIDRLILDLEGEALINVDYRGISRLVKALIAAGRTGSVVRIYGMMKNGGWGSTYPIDEYVVQVLSRGLRKLGEKGLADEIVKEFLAFFEGKLEKMNV